MTPFGSLSRTPHEHFRLHVHGAVLLVRRAFPRPEDAPQLTGFLGDYYAELDRAGFRDAEGADGWWAAVEDWDQDAHGELPLTRLRRVAGLGGPALALLFTAALPEEDGRFALLAEAAGAADRRVTVGLVSAWWGPVAAAEVGPALRRLRELGLLEVGNPDAPRGEWSLRVAPAAWEALRGDSPGRPADWAVYTPRDSLPELGGLVLPGAVAERAAALRAVLRDPAPRAIALRGPPSSGRRTLAAALARSVGLGLLELDDPSRLAGLGGTLATLLDAMPAARVEAGLGETVEVPRPAALEGPLALMVGRHGSTGGPGARDPILLELGIPDARVRERHWAHALGERAPADLTQITRSWRTTTGTVRRAARIAATEAALAGRTVVDHAHVRAAFRVLQGHGLERHASRVDAAGDWSDLAAGAGVRRELELLELRCRYREAPGLGPGVRALFSGPSGTGKTLAARLLASVLGKDLYRCNLATIVDKYLGQTEKNLDEVLSRAEELDVVLLLDEGDALLGHRTDVRNANDRYANLETNFLLQRLEAFEGVIVVTTNTGDRLDPAFRRRIDVVVEFRAPDAMERWSLWQLHLPRTHMIEPGFLDELAGRCALTGGQIRNATLHAELLALEHGGALGSEEVDAAVRREYRKAGAACPLRPRNGSHG
jgi:AAA+ superfamily predicted ATPase